MVTIRSEIFFIIENKIAHTFSCFIQQFHRTILTFNTIQHLK